MIDADIVAFRTAAASEKEDFGICRYYIDQLIDDIMLNCRGDTYELFISGKGNFRYNIYPEYKANRDGSYIPRHREDAKQYLIDKGANVSEGCEADDMMGVAQCSAEEDTIIASLDKDLLMIPGRHYSWEISGRSKDTPWTKPAIWREMADIDCLRWFYTQCITGDIADNIKGIKGRGKKWAENALDPCETEQEMFDVVREEFGIDEEFLLNGRCLWLWRELGDDWIKRFNKLKGDDESNHSGESGDH